MDSKQVAPEPPSPASLDRSMTISIQNSKEGPTKEEEESPNDSQIGQALRAAILGANDGLLTTASLMMGVGAVNPKLMILSGLAALIAGASSMAIGEFVSVQTQRDVEIAILKRRKNMKKGGKEMMEKDGTETQAKSSPSGEILKKISSFSSISSSEIAALPNPLLAACSSAIAFSVGAFLPLISAAFIGDYNVRVGVLAGVSSLLLFMFGAVGDYFGGVSVVKGGLRVLGGGWIAMSVTYGLFRLFHRTKVHLD